GRLGSSLGHFHGYYSLRQLRQLRHFGNFVRYVSQQSQVSQWVVTRDLPESGQTVPRPAPSSLGFTSNCLRRGSPLTRTLPAPSNSATASLSAVFSRTLPGPSRCISRRPTMLVPVWSQRSISHASSRLALSSSSGSRSSPQNASSFAQVPQND